MCTGVNSGLWRTLGYTGARITPGNTLLLKGNRAGRARKPDTESTVVQGMTERGDLSSG